MRVVVEVRALPEPMGHHPQVAQVALGRFLLSLGLPFIIQAEAAAPPITHQQQGPVEPEVEVLEVLILSFQRAGQQIQAEAVVVLSHLHPHTQAAQAAPVSSLFNTPLPHQPKQPAFFHSQAVPYGYALLV